MQRNRFSSPSKDVLRSPEMEGVASSGFMLAVNAEPPEAMVCERVAATISAFEKQDIIREKMIGARLGFDQLVGMGYVDMRSKFPSRGDWSGVTFTGKDGISSIENVSAARGVIMADLLRHHHEALSHARASGIMVAGKSASEKEVLILSATKGVSWVADYAAQGSPEIMLDEIPASLRRVLEGEAPVAIISNYSEMESVDVAKVYDAISDQVSRSGLPISFDRMIGMGMIDMRTPRPADAEAMKEVIVKIGGEDFMLDEVAEDENLRRSVGTMFVSEIRDDLVTRWKGSDEITPEQAVAIAAVSGINAALDAAANGPETEAEVRASERLGWRLEGANFPGL